MGNDRIVFHEEGRGGIRTPKQRCYIQFVIGMLRDKALLHKANEGIR